MDKESQIKILGIILWSLTSILLYQYVKYKVQCSTKSRWCAGPTNNDYKKKITTMLKANIISIHKIWEWRGLTQHAMLLLQWGPDGREPGYNVYWAETVWLMARVRTLAVRLTLSPRHISMCKGGPKRVTQIPRWKTKLTVSSEWDLFSRMGKYG